MAESTYRRTLRARAFDVARVAAAAGHAYQRRADRQRAGAGAPGQPSARLAVRRGARRRRRAQGRLSVAGRGAAGDGAAAARRANAGQVRRSVRRTAPRSRAS